MYTAQPTIDATDRRCQLDRVTVLIDGFNLYHGLKAESGRKWLWLDLEKLSESLLKSGQQLVTVRYFTAAVRKDAEGGRRQDTYLQALGAHCPRVQVHLGRFQQRSHRCPSCQELRRTFEEKETDVSLAVELVEGAATTSFDTVILLTGDSDFIPAIKSAKRLNSELRVISVFPPRRSSEALRKHSDAAFVLGMGRIRTAQLPHMVSGPVGPLIRPAHWS
ncbi:MAG: NYN domain-containing protein [Candidatus Nanopelagicales bacterium]|nr:NYN domain-containing protein [Candidatus Nanopelagicales bacterium]